MGPDTVDRRTAWKTYRVLCGDPRMLFVHEPEGIEPVWQEIASHAQPATNVWTDAYLQAFAHTRDLSVATFDRGFRRLAGPKALILT